ncbi:uncharacterized protein LOC121652695 [Melanotaenia boesemani]|uniref:uncharacterized protein LOC121652695 n=1 Tax=Melanotaenia boesemani TaxID=1250792 RepID=UPI001C05ED5C|nr:uncharacterized protein LOC121652695 [Melanotaenia boesemani]
MLGSTFGFCFVIFSKFLSGSAGGGQKITAEPGHDVSLPCRAGHDGDIKALRWIRPDRKQDVFLYRDGHFDHSHQHPSFQNRVDLQDRQMKDGDVSLILKNLTTNDTGKYECRVFQRGTGREQVIKSKIIHLEVSPAGTTQDGGDKDEGGKGRGIKDGGDKDGGGKGRGNQDGGDKDGGHQGLIVGLSIVGIIVMIVGICICKRRRRTLHKALDLITNNIMNFMEIFQKQHEGLRPCDPALCISHVTPPVELEELQGSRGCDVRSSRSR